MRKLIVNLLWMVSATALLVVASPIAARAEESIVVATVPFAFIVGNLRLPAGDYVVRQTFDTPDVLTITSKDGRQTATILTIPSLPDPQAATSELVFEKFAGQHFLSRVEAGDGDAREIVLTPAIMEHDLATTASNAGQ
jgi:hypothetical protein